jgi:hypothetical protein
VVRWDGGVTVSIGFGRDDGDPVLQSCQIRDPAGNCVTADPSCSTGLAQVAAEAERALAARLVPQLTATCESGEPVRFGDLAIDTHGVTLARGRGPGPWQVPWQSLNRVDVDGPGRGIRFRPADQASRWVSLQNCPNGVIAHHVIGHAAGRAGVPVRNVDRSWRREALTGRPAATSDDQQAVAEGEHPSGDPP